MKTESWKNYPSCDLSPVSHPQNAEGVTFFSVTFYSVVYIIFRKIDAYLGFTYYIYKHIYINIISSR